MNPLPFLTRLLPTHLTSLLSPPQAETEQAWRLAHSLGVRTTELPLVQLGPRYHYRPFAIAKPDGRERRILAPSPALKTLQRRLLDDYLVKLRVHPCATAFQPGASIATNARRHAGQTLIATVDLRDFFESTTAGRVRAFFVRQGWRAEALATLMRVCVYRGSLPQGAPTSPALSNLVNFALDEKLNQLAGQSGAVYTRYGDDLTFSWRVDRMPAAFKSAVEERLGAAGYAIQARKGWQVKRIHEKPLVTGFVLGSDGRLQIPWAMRVAMWRLRWLAWRGNERAVEKLAGYEGFTQMLQSR